MFSFVFFCSPCAVTGPGHFSSRRSRNISVSRTPPAGQCLLFSPFRLSCPRSVTQLNRKHFNRLLLRPADVQPQYVCVRSSTTHMNVANILKQPHKTRINPFDGHIGRPIGLRLVVLTAIFQPITAVRLYARTADGFWRAIRPEVRKYLVSKWCEVAESERRRTSWRTVMLIILPLTYGITWDPDWCFTFDGWTLVVSCICQQHLDLCSSAALHHSLLSSGTRHTYVCIYEMNTGQTLMLISGFWSDRETLEYI